MKTPRVDKNFTDLGQLEEACELESDYIPELDMTIHSMIRCKQRGIKVESLGLIKLFGTKDRMPGGVYRYIIRKKDKQAVITHLRQWIQKIDKLAGKAIIIDNSECILITAYHDGK
jgi:hypothetical protein